MSEQPNESAPPVDNNVPTPSQQELDDFRAWQASRNEPVETGENVESDEKDDTTWIVGHDGERVKTSDYDFAAPYDPTKADK